MSRNGLYAVVAVLAVVGGAVALVLSLRGPGPEEVAEDYLRAQWSGDWRTQCDLATLAWRDADLYGGHPFADCAAYADAAKDANADNPFLSYADDTDVQVTVTTLNDADGRARRSTARGSPSSRKGVWVREKQR